ncbi:MAG TPA: sugar ABC transporter substrate-binding protein [Herpetosiphonaceae bacterium]
MRWRRRLELFSWMAIAAMILAACGAASAPQGSTGGTTTIRWRTQPGSTGEQAAYQALADDVTQALTSQKIQVIYEPDLSEDYVEKLKNELAAGTAPDVFWIGGVWLADIVATGQVLDLKPYVDADPSITLDDFYDQPLRELSHDGKLYGLPRDVSTLVVYYNADLFQAAGITTPKELVEQGAWDWNALLDSARQLTDPARGQYGVGWGNSWGLGWGYFVPAAGGKLFNAEGTACALNSPETIAAAQFARTFYAEKLRPTGGLDTLENLFNAGRVGMMWSGRWTTPSIRRDARFNWDVAEMPAGKQRSTWLFWGAYLINARTANPDAAWHVLKQLTGEESMGKTADLGLTIPARKSQAAVDRFLKSAPPNNNQAFLAGMAYAIPEAPLWNGSWWAYSTTVQNLWDRMIAGEITPEEFAERACG